MELVYLSVFGNVAAFSVGVIPIQNYYLYRKGMGAGSGVGMLILRYVFHKSSIFFYAAVMLLVQNSWLRSVIPGLMKYIYLGFGICGGITLFLLLLCVSERVQQLLLLAVGKIPDKGNWHDRKTVWTENLEAFYQESRAAVGNPASRVVSEGELLGNTQYIAQIIQRETGSELFRIETVQEYPTTHDPLLEFAYISFTTHGGSGFSRNIQTISELQPDANVISDGLSISRNDVAEAESDVVNWVSGLDLSAE